ncbi:UPF0758 protein YsxA [Xylanibacillus composti]|uniref:UPF0758 protein YsxA n=1 Tax=Xylanibacillus composti TaxID=1572762 RepID=A0A8J4M3L1_9BACL|nr:DNA repair protein RadC [Xylanibacillus composti]GIQ70177.1 UPF0758 protein YsxA [Xylanibacillus composti]
MSTAMMLRELPAGERPRERMLASGEQALANAELLAILIRTGTQSESAIALAQRLLREAEGLHNLVDMSVEQLTAIKGIGTAKALQIKAGIELGKRLARTAKKNAFRIHSPQDVADYIKEDVRYLCNEHFICLYLNTKNGVIGHETLSVGSLNASIVHPREVFRAAMKRACASIICVHNHPSGDPTPSPEDIQITRRLAEAGQIVGIELLDHVIVGDQDFISLKEQGLL